MSQKGEPKNNLNRLMMRLGFLRAKSWVGKRVKEQNKYKIMVILINNDYCSNLLMCHYCIRAALIAWLQNTCTNQWIISFITTLDTNFLSYFNHFINSLMYFDSRYRDRDDSQQSVELYSSHRLDLKPFGFFLYVSKCVTHPIVNLFYLLQGMKIYLRRCWTSNIIILGCNVWYGDLSLKPKKQIKLLYIRRHFLQLYPISRPV